MHQYKALKIVCNSNVSYEELLLHSNEVSIHQKQLRLLATEVFKSLADLNPDFMKSYFTIKEIPYCLRNGNFLKIPSARSTRYGTNPILFRACLVWNKLPLSVKQSQSNIEFKSSIKVLKQINCFCKRVNSVYRILFLSDDFPCRKNTSDLNEKAAHSNKRKMSESSAMTSVLFPFSLSNTVWETIS